jgi:hypothetical protein
MKSGDTVTIHLPEYDWMYVYDDMGFKIGVINRGDDTTFTILGREIWWKTPYTKVKHQKFGVCFIREEYLNDFNEEFFMGDGI